jgi:nucleotide-binding universal stress UspA family protein
MRKYLESVAESLRAEGLTVRTVVTGSYPARTIVDVGKREGVDLIMITRRDAAAWTCSSWAASPSRSSS